MYQKHFGLTERPFSIAPDPRFLYMSRQHREALAHLLYGIGEGGGFVQLTGEVGTGKTTICRCLLEQLPDHVDLALILNPRVNEQELLASLCDELHVPYPRDSDSLKVLTDALSAYLLDTHARGRRTVLMIDEAQNLSAEALEQVRLLTNLETTREKLLQIILVGQPELRQLLAREDLRQLSQRITARYHLEPISRDETAAYIRHRLQVCGADAAIFSDAAIDLVQALSGGVPRLINVLCDRAMLGAFVEGKRHVEVPIVRKAAAEVLPEEGLQRPARGWRWLALGSLVLGLGLSAYALLSRYPPLAARWPSSPGASQQTLALPAPMPAPTREPPATVVRPPPETAPESLSSEAAAVGNQGEEARHPGTTGRVQTVAQALRASDLQRLLAQAGAETATQAWAALYRLWGIQAHVLGDEQACAQAPGVGLRCLQGGGSWTVLAQLDRPAIVLLISPEGRRVPAVLLELLGDEVRLRVADKELLVPVDEVKQVWLGHYRILWKTPPKGSAVLRPGDRSSDVAWLRDRIQKVTGVAAISADAAYYDQGLKEVVQEFQRREGLQADGIAGAHTLINLNNLERPPTVPRLGAVKG